MEVPRWYHQLRWSEPVLLTALNWADVPAGSGLYVFTRDMSPLSPANVLYVGKSDGARQTLRNRLGVYYRRLTGGKPVKHAGCEDLYRYFRQAGEVLFVRWAGVVVARELEGTLLSLFDPPFNHRDEHRTGFADDELIPAEMLY